VADREDEGAAPLDEDAAWAALVAGFDTEPEPGAERAWPDAENVVDEPPAPKPAPPARSIVVHPVISGPRDYAVPDDDEDDHYVPPEPPPFPRLRPGAVVALVLFAMGALLLLAPGLVGIAPRVATPLALISLSCGIGWLVLRMRTGPPPDSGPDDGAQL
jgi:hypothetical protein